MEPQEVESFSATGIDNALDLLEVVNAKTDKASVGQQAAGIERHPEVSVDVDIYAQLAETCPCPSLSQRRFKVRTHSDTLVIRRARAYAHVSWSIN